MDNKKHDYNAETMGLPPLRFVLGNIPSPDPDLSNKPNQQTRKSGRKIESTVKRIIAHLEED